MANANLFVRGLNSPGTAPSAAQVRVRELVVDQSTGTLFTQKTDGTIRVVNPVTGTPPQSVFVDFGNVPISSVLSVYQYQGANVGQSIMASIGGKSQIGAFNDELEMDPIIVSGQVVAANTILFSLTCTSPGGLVIGTREVTFYLG